MAETEKTTNMNGDTTKESSKEGLLSIYQEMSSSFKDLTFKHFTTRPRAIVEPSENLHHAPGSDASVDFSQGLQALKSPSPNVIPPLPSATRESQPPKHSNTQKASKRKSTKPSPSNNYVPITKSDKSNDIRHEGGYSKGSTSPSREASTRTRTTTSKSKRSNSDNTMADGATPHSNQCALCETHTVWFRVRCLVCGKCYCYKCVKDGMGEMPEGRKCHECVGKDFSRRYVKKAGKSWLFHNIRTKELKWKKAKGGATKGPMKGIGGSKTTRKSTSFPRMIHNLIIKPWKKDHNYRPSLKMSSPIVRSPTPSASPMKSPMRSPMKSPMRSPMKSPMRSSFSINSVSLDYMRPYAL